MYRGGHQTHGAILGVKGLTENNVCVLLRGKPPFSTVMESPKGMLQTEGRAHTLGKGKILEDRKSLWFWTRMGG